MQNRFAKRVDRSQPAIVKALRQVCGQVEVTNMGNDFPDLLCSVFRTWKLIEVKEPDGHFSRGQLKFIADSLGPIDVVVGENDAIHSIHSSREITNYAKERIGVWLLKNPNQETIRVKKLLGIIGREIDKPGTNGSES